MYFRYGEAETDHPKDNDEHLGGIDRKIKLLALEQIDTDKFFVPKKGTAL